MGSLAAEIRELFDLQSMGALTTEEFANAKKAAIEKYTSNKKALGDGAAASFAAPSDAGEEEPAEPTSPGPPASPLEGLRNPKVTRPAPVSVPGFNQDTAEWLCGLEHTAAVAWMEEAKTGCQEVADGLAEVSAMRINDVITTCFTEARRAYSLQVGAAVFDVIDADGDGQLSSEELANYLHEFPELRERLADEGTARLSRDWCLLMTMIDRDGSAKLDRDEFCDFFCAGNLGLREEAEAMFDEIDVDWGGTIEGTEFRQHLEAHPDFRDRIARAKAKAMASAWDKLLGNVRSDARGSRGSMGSDLMSPCRRFTRDDFAELWADSGLGAAPDGLGIMSSMSPGGAPKAVPGYRARAHRDSDEKMRQRVLTGEMEPEQGGRFNPTPQLGPSEPTVPEGRRDSANVKLVEGLASPARTRGASVPQSELSQAEPGGGPARSMASIDPMASFNIGLPTSPMLGPRTPPATGSAEKRALPKRRDTWPQSASLAGRMRAGDRSNVYGRRNKLSSPHKLSKQLAAGGKVDYGALLREQDIDLQRREKSMEGYQKMLEEVRKYNEQVMKMIWQQYERCVEGNVIDKWKACPADRFARGYGEFGGQQGGRDSLSNTTYRAAGKLRASLGGSPRGSKQGFPQLSLESINLPSAILQQVKSGGPNQGAELPNAREPGKRGSVVGFCNDPAPIRLVIPH